MHNKEEKGKASNMNPTGQPPHEWPINHYEQPSQPPHEWQINHYEQPGLPPYGLLPSPHPHYPMYNYYMHPAGKVLWSTGICDCCYDVPNCMITMFCPCVTFGQIAEILDSGSVPCFANGLLYSIIFCVSGLACLYSCFYRSRMRHQYMLAETPYPDWCLHLCCEPCALCQEYRELQNRGFDLYIGYNASIEKMHKKAMEQMELEMPAPPVVEPEMKR